LRRGGGDKTEKAEMQRSKEGMHHGPPEWITHRVACCVGVGWRAASESQQKQSTNPIGNSYQIPAANLDPSRKKESPFEWMEDGS
jgi:hypothetical protein